MTWLLLLACGSDPTPPEIGPEPVAAPIEVPEPGLPMLTLNGMEKWQADEHT